MFIKTNTRIKHGIIIVNNIMSFVIEGAFCSQGSALANSARFYSLNLLVFGNRFFSLPSIPKLLG